MKPARNRGDLISSSGGCRERHTIKQFVIDDERPCPRELDLHRAIRADRAARLSECIEDRFRNRSPCREIVSELTERRERKGRIADGQLGSSALTSSGSIVAIPLPV